MGFQEVRKKISSKTVAGNRRGSAGAATQATREITGEKAIVQEGPMGQTM
jgi:hypothetical protein